MKARLVADAKAHQAADRYVQGAYLDTSEPEWKGCAVGCTTAPLLAENLGVEVCELGVLSWHEQQERLTGIPAWLGHVEDAIFEGLPVKDAREWPVRFLSALPVGVDLAPVRDAWLRDVVFDPTHGAMAHAAGAMEAAGLTEQAAKLSQSQSRGSADAAAQAARSAAMSAEDAAAADAAADAWSAAWYAAGSAAMSAEDAAWDAVWDAAWQWMADRLVARLDEVAR